MAIYYGNDGYVNGVDCVNSWSLTESVATQMYSSSNSPGGTVIPAGVVSWNGSMSGYGAEPDFLTEFFAGDTFSFRGVVDNFSSPKVDWNATAVINQVTIDLNRTTQADVTWQADFGVNGVATAGTTGGSQSGTVVAVENGKDLLLSMATSGDPTAVSDICIQSAQLVFRKPLITTICAGSPTHLAGNLEVDLNVTVSTKTLNVSDFAANGLKIVELMVSPTTFWYFEWMRVIGKSNFNVTMNSPISYTVQMKWSATNGSTSAGSIVGPSTAAYYGS